MAQFIKSSEPQKHLAFVNLDTVSYVTKYRGGGKNGITFHFDATETVVWVYESQELLDRDIRNIESLCKVAPDGTWGLL